MPSRDDDAWERRLNEDIEECWECGKKFHWKRETSVEYITECYCEDNKEEHDFDIENSIWIDSNEQMQFRIVECKKCSKCKVEKRIK